MKKDIIWNVEKLSKGELEMQKYGLNELREMYLSFFESKQHLRLPSFSLVPENDPSLLLINAGMAPLKPYFTGEQIPPSKRVTTCQKCIRTLDIENVGKTSRHGTFFEMLGNFSFGDYFKKEAITWAWEFCIDVLKLPQDKLYISIYENDDEAFEIWRNETNVSVDRIVRLGKEDNFWEHGTGPCGPCSEIYFDRGIENGCGKPDCGPGCDCDRFVEFWNNVFTQFDRQEDGSYLNLPSPNIDTGMGLERLACICQDVNSIFEVDTIQNVLKKVCEIANVEYGKEYKIDVSIRVITDHIRSTTMLVSDGVFPSNEGRGYVLRRLLRRAARHGRMLGISGLFLKNIAEVVIAESCEAYPQLKQKHDYIINVITNEEQAFNQTIDKGLGILNEIINELKLKGSNMILGVDVFKLHDTYGFPFDLTKEIAEENNLQIDEVGFQSAMNEQKTKAREAANEKNSSAWGASVFASLNEKNTEFLGYTDLSSQAKVLHLFVDNQEVDSVSIENTEVQVILDKTPFYGESGGQAGDKGRIETSTGWLLVNNTTKTANNLFVHNCILRSGKVSKNDNSQVLVDKDKRNNTCRNHTATHLIQAALKTVLGNHVAQAGSSVDDQRLRFDFLHFAAMTDEEIAEVELYVNSYIYANYAVTVDEMSIKEAKENGATALFDSKYGETVRVVRIGDASITVSMELCGGTHVSNTSEIGLVKILAESGVAAGTRRIEAVSSRAAFDYLNDKFNSLETIAKSLKVSLGDVSAKVTAIVAQLKDATKENDMLKSKIILSNVGELIENSTEFNGVKVVISKFENVDLESLKTLSDTIKNKLENVVVLFASISNDKVSFISMASKAAVNSGAHCGNVVKMVAQACGGGGGGRPDMAQAGAKDVSKVEEALIKAEELIKEQVI